MKLSYVLPCLCLLLTSCISPSLSPYEKETVQQIYQQEFSEFAAQGYHQQQNGRHIYMADHDNTPALFAQMVADINARLRQNGLNLTVTPYSHENCNKALRQQVEAAFPQIFNELHNEVTPARNYMAEALTFDGKSLQDSAFYAGDVNKKYYEKYYIAATLLHIPGLSLNDSLRWQVLSVKIPYTARNKNLRQAEIAARNWNFEEADKYFALGRNASGSRQVKAIIERERKILPRYRQLVAQQNASAAYWAKKREAERSSVNWAGVMIGGLNSFSNTMLETGNIIAESNMNTAIATQSGYQGKRIEALEDRVYSNTASSAVPEQTFVPESAYRLRLNAVKRMNAAYVEREALYRIKGNLMGLYHDEEQGRVFRQTIDKAVADAEREYEHRKEAFDKLQSDNAHVDAVRAYIQSHPEADAAVQMRAGRGMDAIERRYLKLKQNYEHFYRQEKSLY